MTSRPHRPERQSTDAGLKAERRKTDAEVRRGTASAGREADLAVRGERSKATSALRAARHREDVAMKPASAAARGRLRSSRARDDRARLLRERRLDARTLRSRAARSYAFATLLAAERTETDRRLLVERVRADDLVDARDELLAIVSHDLRGFLSAIALQTLALSEAADDRGSVTTAARSITDASGAMSRLVGDLLDAAAAAGGRLRLRRATAELEPLIASSVAAFSASAAGKGVELVFASGPPCPPARLDDHRILQVLANLIGNAIKFTPAGGRITVRVVRRGDVLRVSVADTGVGVAPADLDGIFDRFVQGRCAGAGRGVGLGLFISRAIVAAHGGRIWAKSAVGGGSTFSFTLPCAHRSARGSRGQIVRTRPAVGGHARELRSAR